MSDILIVAGESSGEKYGAGLVREFRKLRPAARFFGVGGKQMASQGVNILFPVERLSVVGIFELMSQVPRIRKLFRCLLRETAVRLPSAAVLIDSPDFNLRLARRLNKMGIPVLYYVSPTVWAWRRSRLKAVRRHVSKMLLIFPFEEEIYRSENIPAAYIGHPLLERLQTDLTREELFARYGLDPEKKLIALLPGSRKSELKFHAPVLLPALEMIRKAEPVQFVLVLAESLTKEDLQRAFPLPLEGLTVLDQDGTSAIAGADLVLSACGTATLEAALLGTPVVAFYRISPLTYRAGRRFVKVASYSIVNILAGKEVIPELIQENFTPENLTRETIRILASDDVRAVMKSEFRKIKESLGEGLASKKAALELDGFFSSNNPPA